VGGYKQPLEHVEIDAFPFPSTAAWKTKVTAANDLVVESRHRLPLGGTTKGVAATLAGTLDTTIGRGDVVGRGEVGLLLAHDLGLLEGKPN
jgi:hypothetical protein